MQRSVLTTARPPDGTIAFSAEAKSNPADWGEPRVGIFACSLRSLTWRHDSTLFIIILLWLPEEEEEEDNMATTEAEARERMVVVGRRRRMG